MISAHFFSTVTQLYLTLQYASCPAARSLAPAPQHSCSNSLALPSLISSRLCEGEEKEGRQGEMEGRQVKQ